MTKKILLLGSGELGKEFTIAAQRLGQYVIACDSYAGAPAMQVADACEVFSMLDGEALDRVVEKYRPDIIVPEIEAIRTERLYHLEKEGIQVVPSARAVNFTMNRKAIRDLAAKELGLKTAKYFYASSYEELKEAAGKIGYPCVIKPLMSSSGKGQSVAKSEEDLKYSWEYGCSGSRGDIKELEEDVGVAGVEGVFEVGLVEIGKFKRAGLVDGAELDKVEPLANARELGLARDDGADTGILAGDEVGDLLVRAAVVVGAGKVGKVGAQVGDAEFGERLGARFAHAFDIANIGVERRHAVDLLYKCGVCLL